MAQHPVQRADGEVDRHNRGDLGHAGDEDVAGENLLEVFGALRGTVDQ
jgi:hypothetical protein